MHLELILELRNREIFDQNWGKTTKNFNSLVAGVFTPLRGKYAVPKRGKYAANGVFTSFLVFSKNIYIKFSP